MQTRRKERQQLIGIAAQQLFTIPIQTFYGIPWGYDAQYPKLKSGIPWISGYRKSHVLDTVLLFVELYYGAKFAGIET